MLSICAFFFTVVIFRADGSTTPDDYYVHCLPDWYAFGNHCYKGFGHEREEQLKWDGAREKCGKKGKLASIHSKEQQDFLVTNIILNLKTSVYFGLNDKVSEANYTYDDGSAVDFFQWHPGEPSGKDREWEDCVEIWYAVTDNIGNWNDVNCDHIKAFICQMDQDNTYSEFDPRFRKLKNAIGHNFPPDCYIPVQEEKNWTEAEKYCIEKYGGHLLSMREFSIHKFLEYTLKEPFNSTMHWIGINITEQQLFEWTSGWFVSFLNWEDPNFAKKKRQAGFCSVRLNTGGWDIKPCSDKFPFICEVSSISPPTPLEPPKDNAICPMGEWTDLGGDRCYFFELNERISWYEAYFKCLQMGGNLTSIHSANEMLILRQFLGLTTTSTYIGLMRDKDDPEKFRWIDGTKFDYDIWNVGEPNGLEEKCVEILGQVLRWNDNTCDKHFGYTCNTFKVPPNKTTVLPAVAKCVDGISGTEVGGVAICVLVVVVLVMIFLYFCRPWEKETQDNLRKISHDVLQAAKPRVHVRHKDPELIVFEDN